MNLRYRFEKFLHRFLAVTIAILFLFSLVSCSEKNEQTGSNEPIEETEANQLEDENERLRTELETANENLKDLEQRLEELEAAMIAAPSEASTEPSESISPQINLEPPTRSLKEQLLGEWFYQVFHEESVNSWMQSLVFYANGSGRIVRTFYFPAYLNADNFSTSDYSSEATLDFSWRLNDDTVYTTFDGDGVTSEYTFLPEQQQLVLKRESGKEVTNTHIYEQKKPAVPDGYVESIVIFKDIQATEAALMRRFLGLWYFDLTTWIFNDDGTGVLDIPEWGDQPAVTREFSFSVTEKESEMMLTVEWADTSEIVFFWPKIRNDGSIMLNDAVKLTREFDPNNCPVSMEIISNGYNAIFGSMFTDLFPQ